MIYENDVPLVSSSVPDTHFVTVILFCPAIFFVIKTNTPGAEGNKRQYTIKTSLLITKNYSKLTFYARREVHFMQYMSLSLIERSVEWSRIRLEASNLQDV